MSASVGLEYAEINTQSHHNSCEPSMFPMSNIIELPHELVALIFVLCRDIQTVLRLSFSNRRLRDIWLKNHEHVIKTILECEIPAYEDAVQLAKTEAQVFLAEQVKATTATSEASHSSVLDSAQASPPPHSWLPRLMRNTDLAKSVCSEIEASLKHRLPRDPSRRFPFLPWPSSYYLVRQMALSYHALHLRPALLSTLETCSMDAMQTHMEVCGFMVVSMSSKEQLRHGVPKADEDRTLDDELNDNFAQPDWEQAYDVMFEIWERRGCRAALRQYADTA